MNSENQDNIEGKLEKLRRYGKKEEKDKIPEDVYLKTEKSKAPDDKKSLEETETREAVSEYEIFKRLFEQGKSAYENGDFATAESKLLEAAYVNPEEYGGEVLKYTISQAKSNNDEATMHLGFDIASIRSLKNRDNLLDELCELYINLN